MDLAIQHHRAGRLPQAEALYRQILEADPNHPSALHLIGAIAHQMGENDVAVDFITKALAVQPDFAEAHNNLGTALKDLGRLDDAVASYHRALALRPDYAGAHNNLGTALQDLGRLDDAVASYLRALALQPDFAGAHSNLGNALKDLGRLDDAVASYRKALALEPEYAAAHSNLGNALQDLGRPDDAVASYRKALALKPDYAEAHSNLGNALKALGRLDDAIANHRKALALKPDYAEAHNNLGNALQHGGELEAAVAAYRGAIALKPGYAEAHNNLGTALQDLGRPDDAVASYREALALEPDYAEVHSNLGNALQDLGRLDDAVASHRQALALKPDFAEAHNNLSLLYEKTNDVDNADIHVRKALDIDPDLSTAHISLAVLLRRRGKIAEAIRRLEGLPVETLSKKNARGVHFELGKLYDRDMDSARAFEHFDTANRIGARIAPGNVDADRALNTVERDGRLLTPEFLASWTDAVIDPAVEPPVFLVGFPRSGTTLLDRILDGHPRLQVMEEKPALLDIRSAVDALPGGYPAALAALQEIDVRTLRDRYLRNVERHIDRRPGTILVDKLPLNICSIPLIVRLFPNARMILALRHPCDAVLSNFMQDYKLNDAMANFLTIEGAARYYKGVMGFWLQCAGLFPLRVHTIRYEDLVDDFEGEIRGLLQFLDLDWTDAVLDYRGPARHGRRIDTPSYAQVTEPIYQRAKFRWTRYEDVLKPVFDDLQPFIEAFRYADP